MGNISYFRLRNEKTNNASKRLVVGSFRNLFLLIITISILLTSLGCRNEMKDISDVIPFDTLQKEMSKDLIFEYSEFGNPTFKMLAPLMVTYNDGKEELMIFDKGILIYFYNEDGDMESEISSLYATNNTTKKLITLRGNVIIINYAKREKIKTEELFWDQNTKKIWSDKFVRIITDDRQLEGYGFETDEDIQNYSITKPTGIFEVSEDEQIK